MIREILELGLSNDKECIDIRQLYVLVYGIDQKLYCIQFFLLFSIY